MSTLPPATVEPALRHKLDACRSALRDMQRVVVAYSGGVDSTLLLSLAVETLGRENVVAAMAVSTIFPQRDAMVARRIVKELGVELVEIATPQLADTHFTANPADRCYYCKSQLMSQLKEFAAARGFGGVVSGAHADDTHDYRPGSKAETQLGIRRPMLDAGMTKTDIREASATLGVTDYERPSMACLASRIPYGETITEEKLARVDACEEFLTGLGFRQCRVRDHGRLARIEVPDDQIELAFTCRERITAQCKLVGYTYVTIDLQGFRTGSMNEVLADKENDESRAAP